MNDAMKVKRALEDRATDLADEAAAAQQVDPDARMNVDTPAMRVWFKQQMAIELSSLAAQISVL